MLYSKISLIIILMIVIISATPKTISYQGVLTDINGSPKNNGSYDIIFSLYTVEKDGTHLWRSTKTVELKEGIFSILLGNNTPFDNTLDFTKPYWLGIQMGADAELTPRIALAASPYAIRSSVSDFAVNAAAAVNAGSADVAILANTVKVGAVASPQILDGSINRIDMMADLKAPFADTADYAKTADVALSVSGAAIASETITTSQIANGTIKVEDLEDGFSAPEANHAANADTAGTLAAGYVAPHAAFADSTLIAASSHKAVTAESVSGGAIKGVISTSRIEAKDSTGLTLSGSAERNIFIDSNGVAISSDDNKNIIGLTVENKTANSIIAVKGWAATTNYGQDFIGSNARLHIASDKFISLNTNAKERLRVTSEGKVGIGTQSPTSPLTVSITDGVGGFGTTPEVSIGSASGDALPAIFATSDRADYGFFLAVKGVNSEGFSNAAFIFNARDSAEKPLSSGNLFKINNYASNKFTVAHNGNVGIGVETPGKTLDVDGTVRATSYLIGNSIIGSSTDSYWSNGTSDGTIHYTGGKVGIGTSAPEAALDIKGDVKIEQNLSVTGNVTAANFPSSSDIRYKKNISPITTPLEKIKALTGVTYEWKQSDFPDRNFSERTQIGVVAQELEKVFPELVHTDSEGYKAVSYDKLSAVLIEAVKEQQLIIEAQDQRLKKQEMRLKRIEAKLNIVD